VFSAACPPLSEIVPRTLEPSAVNVTVPVGVPPPVEVTVAVKVTDWPNVDGFSDDTNELVVALRASLDYSLILLAKEVRML
jgi:hypothetical protein